MTAKRLPRTVATASLTLIVMLGVLFISISRTGATPQSRGIFGPETFTRTNGSANVWTRTVGVPANVGAPYTLTVQIGLSGGRGAQPPSVQGSMTLNGLEVVGRTDFQTRPAQITKTVTLAASNTLEVSLSGPGASITVGITGVINLGNLTQARTGHTASLMADGSVLITGGDGPTGVGMSAERFNAVSLTFSAEGNGLNFARGQHTASVLADRSHLITGGQGAGGAAERFVSASAQFSALFDGLRSSRFGHTATSLMDGSVLIMGGRELIADASIERFNPQPTVLFKPPYDPATGAFTLLPEMLALARWDHSATLLPDGRVWILGGRNDFGFLASAEFFDPSTNQSSPSEALPEARAAHTATLLPNGKVLVLGGRNSGGYLSSALIFDPATGALTTVPGLSHARANHTATLLPNGEILVTGGDAGAGPVADTELYGPPALDVTPPAVVQSLPANGATGVDLTQAISVRFSEPVDVRTLTPDSVKLQINPVVDAVISPSENGLLLYVLPTQSLQAGGHYTLTLSPAIRDTAGNPLAQTVLDFTTVEAPTITAVTPDSGPIGTSVTILGQHFDPSSPGLNVVTFGGIAAGVSAANATQIETSVPAGVVPGNVAVAVTTRGGTATSTFGVEYPIPHIDNFSPNNAPAGSGDTVVSIFGTNFVPASGVTFGGTSVLIALQTSERLDVDVTAALLASPGTRDIIVTNPSPGGGTSNAVTFTITGLEISDIAPSSGPVGSTVFITGVGFDPIAANNQVKFNGVAAVVTDSSNTSIETTVPAGATSGPISVTSSAGTAQSATFTITTGAHILINRVPDKSTYGRGEAVTIHTAVVDAAGTTVPNVPVQLTSDPAADSQVGNTFTYNADGIYTITATATSGGTLLEAAAQINVEGQGPTIACSAPQDGGNVNASVGQTINFHGSVNLLNGLTSLSVNGNPVTVDQDGLFSAPIVTAWGTNFVDLAMVDGEGHASHRTCAFLASTEWAQPAAILSSTIGLKGTQTFLDDVSRAGSINSLADILHRVLNSTGLSDTLHNSLLAGNPLKPAGCDQMVFGLCVLSSRVTYISSQLPGPNTVSLTAVTGGVTARVRIEDPSIRLRVNGQVSGIPYDASGNVNFEFVEVDVTFDLAVSGGRPHSTVRNGSVAVRVGQISTHFSGVDGFVINIAVGLANGLVRDIVANTMRGFVSNNFNAALDGVLSAMKVDTLGTSFALPRLNGQPLQVSFGTNFSSLDATASRLLITMGTKFTTSRTQARPTLGAPIFPGLRTLDPTLSLPNSLASTVHSGVFNQGLHALWSGGYFDVFLSDGALNGLIPAGATLKTTAALSPAVQFRSDGRMEISVGALHMRFEDPAQFANPIEGTVGGRVSCRSTLVNSDLKLDDCMVDELHLSTDAELDAQGTAALETFASNFLNTLLAASGNDVLPVLPIPGFPIPASLVPFGLPAGGVLGLTNPTLTIQSGVSSNHAVLRGGFGVK